MLLSAIALLALSAIWKIWCFARAIFSHCSCTEAWSAWQQHFAPAKRVLIIYGGDGDAVGFARLAAEAGCEATVHDPRKSLDEHASGFDVVVVDRYLSCFEEDAARALLAQVFGLMSVGGVLLVQDLSVLPASWAVYVAWSLRQSAAPYDIAAWLPSDADVEQRVNIGLFLEGLIVRKLTSTPNDAVERLRRLYGDTSMAYCTSPEANRIGRPEETIRYFLHFSVGLADGYVAYLEYIVMGVRLRLVLMDPVCAPGDREATVRGFLADCDAAQSRPIFSCVSVDWKATLQRCGLHTTMMGGEVGISLANYTLSKERRRYLRAAPAKGLECHTQCYDLQELEELNAIWVGSKASGTEILIWTWPPSLPQTEAEGDEEVKADEVRRLFCYQDGRLVGFVCAEPYYRGDGSGEALGYGLNTIRFLPQLSPPWISDFTVATLIQSLKDEGKAAFLAFGFSPFSAVARHVGDLPWLRSLNQFAWTIDAESVYPIQGLAKKKAHHCNGQGVALHERFVSADPAFAYGDTVRFMTLLFRSSLHKLPEALGCIISGAASGVLSGGLRLVRMTYAGARSRMAKALKKENKSGHGSDHAPKSASASKSKKVLSEDKLERKHPWSSFARSRLSSSDHNIGGFPVICRASLAIL